MANGISKIDLNEHPAINELIILGEASNKEENKLQTYQI